MAYCPVKLLHSGLFSSRKFAFLLEFNVVNGLCYRASLGWFAFEPELYDMNNMSFAQSEAQSVSVFVHSLSNEREDALQSDSKARARENGGLSLDMVRDHICSTRNLQRLRVPKHGS